MKLKAMKILATSLKSEAAGLVKMIEEADEKTKPFIEAKIRIIEWNLETIKKRLEEKET